MTLRFTRPLALTLPALLASALSAQTPAPPDVLRVTSMADSAEAGTLRWAVETSNGTPGRYRIEIAPSGPAPHVITLTSPLPPIRGPVQIEGTLWKQTGEYVAIDGSDYITDKGNETCPGAVAGQYGTNVRTTTNPGIRLIDTTNVEISGLEIRRFCIGILLNRTSGAFIHDNRVVANRGGAGVMLTGDDGQGNPTSTTTIHNRVLRNDFLDNGDGLELTRGAAFNLVADNVFRSTSANPEPSQGIEILRGNDNVVTRNRFEGYSDGLQINWGDRNYIAANTFTNNTFGLNLSGIGNVVDGNVITGNAVGVALRPAASSTVVRVTRNAISGNGRSIARCEAGGSCDPNIPKGGIVFGLPGGEHAEYMGSRGGGVTPNPATLLHICPHQAPDCQPMPNGGLAAPVITAVRRTNAGAVVNGSVKAAPGARYVIEVFGNANADAREGESFLGDATVITDGSGTATFSVSVTRAALTGPSRSFTATATSADGATSPFSLARRLPRQAVDRKPAS
ncbi:MAG: right-handed parallel beta-helix repeat-containing protein [Acidobacteriota bacterium]